MYAIGFTIYKDILMCLKDVTCVSDEFINKSDPL